MIWLYAYIPLNFSINYILFVYSKYYETPKADKFLDYWTTPGRISSAFMVICPFFIYYFILTWLYKEYQKELNQEIIKDKIREINRKKRGV